MADRRGGGERRSGGGGYQGGGGPRQGGGGPRQGGGGGYQGGDGGGRGRGRGRGPPGGGRGGGRMTADEANYNPQQTEKHLTPIIQRITQLAIAPKGIKMPHKLEPADIELAQRPQQPGQQGLAVKLVTNFFLANVSKVPPIMHHDVRVERLRYNTENNTLEVEKADKGQPERPIPPKLIQDCVHAFTTKYKAHIGAWAYDGRNNLFAPKTLTDPKKLDRDGYHNIDIDLPASEGKKFPRHLRLRLKMVGRITMDDLATHLKGQLAGWPAKQLQALEIIINSPFINNPNMHHISRTLFQADQRGSPVGSGGEAWMGYKQDLRPCQFGLMLSIEPSFSVFFEGKPVTDFCEAVLTKNERQPWQWGNKSSLDKGEAKEVARELKGLLVLGTYGKSGKETAFTATGLSKEGANQYMFPFHDKETGEDKEMSVAAYFSTVLKVKLAFPGLQCVTGRGRRKGESIAVPMELLTIKRGQKRRGVLIGDQQANLVRKAAQAPAQKRADIAAWVQTAAPNFRKAGTEFGLGLATQPAVVTGRLLPAPVLQYGHPANYYAGTTGAWNMINFKLLEPVTIRHWAIVVLKDGRDLAGNGPGSLTNFVSAINTSFGSMGIKMLAPGPAHVEQVGDLGRFPDPSYIDQAVRKTLTAVARKNATPDVVFFIIPRKDPTIYKLIKREMDSIKGIVSQVIVAGKASGLGRAGADTKQNSQLQYGANVGLKVNHKLGGRNVQVRGLGAGSVVQAAPPIWSSKPTMLIGIDVSHPQSFDESEPSIVGIVASMDRSFAQYACRIKRIGYREEVVAGMKDDIKELLQVFYERNRVKPEAIVVYRDGVSQGEFKEVLAKEYTAIREAGLDLEAGYTPPITYSTVLKRHKARLFPEDPAVDDGSGNVRPGTCVDTGIALAHGFDFYLNAHKGIQGTVKPAHYHVLHDENAFGADAIQIATYWLSYTFCRCTRSVSYCPPAYYAHLVADRGRILLDRDLSDAGSTVGSSSSGGPRGPGPKLNAINASILNKMFFC